MILDAAETIAGTFGFESLFMELQEEGKKMV
jgi:hypothetical protein